MMKFIILTSNMVVTFCVQSVLIKHQNDVYRLQVAAVDILVIVVFAFYRIFDGVSKIITTLITVKMDRRSNSKFKEKEQFFVSLIITGLTVVVTFPGMF